MTVRLGMITSYFRAIQWLTVYNSNFNSNFLGYLPCQCFNLSCENCWTLMFKKWDSNVMILTISLCLLASSCSSKYSSSRTRSISSRCCLSSSIFLDSYRRTGRSDIWRQINFRHFIDWLDKRMGIGRVVSTILWRFSFASSLSLILAILLSSICCWQFANSIMRLFSASIFSCSMRLHSACSLLNSSMCCWVALTFSSFSCLSLQQKIVFQ